jgi:4'-phosphopantetheinyl transferase
MKFFWLEQRICDVPQDDTWLSAVEWERCRAMCIPKRRAEWRLGRWTAKVALASLNQLTADAQTLAGIEVRSAKSGVPELYAAGRHSGLAMSLSHSNENALCLIASAGVSVGCDLEAIEQRSALFLADYFTEEEREVIQCAGDDVLLVNLIWSAKESVLKALGIGLRGDPRDIRIVVETETPAFNDGAETWFALTARDHTGRSFQGVWRRSGSLVHTIVADNPVAELIKLRPVMISHSATSLLGDAAGF